MKVIETYKNVAIMYDYIKAKYYYYPEYTKGARYFKRIETARHSIDKLTEVK